MRFLAAPWVGLLKDGAWLRNAQHSNAMAALLEQKIRTLPGTRILFPRQAHSVFVELPQPAIQGLREHGWRFYTFIGQGGCRLIASWDTTPQDVDNFIGDLALLLGEKNRDSGELVGSTTVQR